jgi:hypothetical protein
MSNSSFTPIEFKIPDHPDGIQDYITSILNILSANLTLTALVKRKIKLILLELVTNSIKHSKDPNAQIRLSINHPQLTIEKVDVGLQIKFKGTEQIPFKEINKQLVVSFSEKNVYAIQVLDRYHFKFIDSFKEKMDVQELPENFGFYIITMASDNFEYHHNPTLKENTFIVDINL